VPADVGLTGSHMLRKAVELMYRVLHCSIVFFGNEDR
jgi:hypothetical protein